MRDLVFPSILHTVLRMYDFVILCFCLIFLDFSNKLESKHNLVFLKTTYHAYLLHQPNVS